jgi:hypothetical protein
MTAMQPLDQLDLDGVRLMIKISTKQAADLKQKLDDAIRLRDDAIRAALTKGGRVADLAEDADMKAARIYQIRDSRR